MPDTSIASLSLLTVVHIFRPRHGLALTISFIVVFLLAMAVVLSPQLCFPSAAA